jgi:hypothetical protein
MEARYRKCAWRTKQRLLGEPKSACWGLYGLRQNTRHESCQKPARREGPTPANPLFGGFFFPAERREIKPAKIPK